MGWRRWRHEPASAEPAATDDPFLSWLEVVIRVAPETQKTHCGAVLEALCRTRTGDPFLTMEVLYQLS
jgi:hypothetical protein